MRSADGSLIPGYVFLIGAIILFFLFAIVLEIANRIKQRKKDKDLDIKIQSRWQKRF